MPLIRAENLRLIYANGVQALEDVDLVARSGEFVSLVGPSGCGKSTLLRLAAGLLEPSSGRVLLDGKAPREARRGDCDLGFVFQQPTLLPWRSVSANVRLPLELRGGAPRDADERIARTLEMVGLRDFERSQPHELSGGMQMRLSLARALVTEPRALLLDEPFGALDDITRQRLNEELLRLWEANRWTVLFVTHNVAEAAFLSDRVVVMTARPGRILRDWAVPFAHPRRTDLRGTAEFAAFTQELSESLQEAHR